MSFDSWPWPDGLFFCGLLLLLLAVFGTFTGKALGRSGSADRATEPVTYWLMLVTEYLGAAFLIWRWLGGKPK
jgi:hypothetical protein